MAISKQTRQLQLMLQQEEEHVKEIEKIQKSISEDRDFEDLPEETFEHLSL